MSGKRQNKGIGGNGGDIKMVAGPPRNKSTVVIRSEDDVREYHRHFS